jgi:hypothetical protein
MSSGLGFRARPAAPSGRPAALYRGLMKPEFFINGWLAIAAIAAVNIVYQSIKIKG